MAMTAHHGLCQAPSLNLLLPAVAEAARGRMWCSLPGSERTQQPSCCNETGWGSLKGKCQ